MSEPRVPVRPRLDPRLLAALVAVLLLGLAWLRFEHLAAGFGPAQDSRALGARREPVLVSFLPTAVRELLVVDTAVGIVDVSSREQGPRLLELRVSALDGPGAGALIVQHVLDQRLQPDPEYGAIQELLERLPDELTHRHGLQRSFAPPDAAPFQAAEVGARWQELTERVQSLRARYGASGTPLAELPLLLPLDQVFGTEDTAGARRSLLVEIDYAYPGENPRTQSLLASVTRLAPFGRPDAQDAPEMLAALSSYSVQAGDLHVHSCHGEASGACAPSTNCTAESVQLSGSFSYAQLKSQFQALGLNWFTATDHSYCINSTSEFQSIVNEAMALNDASFLCLPDIELSSDEEGPQTGGDIGDLACIFGTQANHMGAHGITTLKTGGGDGFLGFCNGLFTDVLKGFSTNAALVRAEGGWPVINHPALGTSWSWNSISATHGIENNQMHGVEIWNGPNAPGQGSHVASWVNWLLTGRILYAYGGSDTHDAAFDFGANHVLLEGAFNSQNLQQALKAGRVYVSNGPLLVLESELDGAVLPMGTLQSFTPSQAGSSLPLRVSYDFGASSGVISVFRGLVGAAAEVQLCSSALLSGSGVFECADVLLANQRSWYRAFATAADGAQSAYTNPVLFLPSSCSSSSLGIGTGSADIGSLWSNSAPVIGSVQNLQLSGFQGPGSVQAFLGVSTSFVPAGLPLSGGTLWINTPLAALFALPLQAGAASLHLSLPYDSSLAGQSLYWQAVALDLSQPGLLAFSNGLAMPLCALLQ